MQLEALKYFIPFLVLFGLPYYLLWRSNLTLANFKNSVSGSVPLLALIIIAVLLFGIILHELLHGLTWSYMQKRDSNLSNMEYSGNPDTLLSLQRTAAGKTLYNWWTDARDNFRNSSFHHSRRYWQPRTIYFRAIFYTGSRWRFYDRKSFKKRTKEQFGSRPSF